MKRREKGSDPRRAGGDIAGPGGPYGLNDVIVDIRDAVLLDGCEVTMIGMVREGEVDENPAVALKLSGKINQRDERADIVFLAPREGAADIFANILGLAARSGDEKFIAALNAAIADVPT